jgi:hypothetical protein
MSTSPADRHVAIDLAQEADLEPPVARYPHRAGQFHIEHELTGQWISEGVQVDEIGMVADELEQSPNERGEEEPGHPPMHAVRDPGVEPLCVLVGERGIDHRVAESGEHPAVVGDDVGVVNGNRPAGLVGEHVADPGPDPPPLPGWARTDVLGVELAI